MFRSKDFSFMEVVHIRNNRVGFIKDLLINFHNKRIIGFEISSYDIIKKTINVMEKDIISYDSSMVIKNTSRGENLCFKQLKGMDIIDINGNMIGMLEDFLFEENQFVISGAVVSSGVISNYIHGKKILLMEELILGESNILWVNKCNTLNFSSMPHKVILKEGECN